MTSEEKRELKETLCREIEKLREDVSSFNRESKPVAPDSAIGRLTRMEAIQSKEMILASLNRARARLAGLERALEKIESPQFGVCGNCQESISLERLKLMPETLFCVDCAS